MTRLIKSLLGYDRNTASPEEAEAYRVANEALQWRVHAVMQKSSTRMAPPPTTDMFGRRI
ncbi:hypothetical protein [Aestuariivirga sp.]|uniref:hypothetical protein n=1 Tax=Aestuariivirga sp. TaxID=2650926 RepID=UPI0035946C71